VDPTDSLLLSTLEALRSDQIDDLLELCAKKGCTLSQVADKALRLLFEKTTDPEKRTAILELYRECGLEF
jgi:hypothetical protein